MLNLPRFVVLMMSSENIGLTYLGLTSACSSMFVFNSWAAWKVSGRAGVRVARTKNIKIKAHSYGRSEI